MKQLKSIVIGYMAYNNENKDKLRQNQKPKNSCQITVSQPKKQFNKNNQHITIRLFPTLWIFATMLFFIWNGQLCYSLTRKQNELIKYAIMIKSFKKNLKCVVPK